MQTDRVAFESSLLLVHDLYRAVIELHTRIPQRFIQGDQYPLHVRGLSHLIDGYTYPV